MLQPAMPACHQIPDWRTSPDPFTSQRPLQLPLALTPSSPPHHMLHRPPFFPGNEVQDLGVCAIGSDFVGVVKEHEGWEWIDEGQDGIHKWGFVSTAVRHCFVIFLFVSYFRAGA